MWLKNCCGKKVAAGQTSLLFPKKPFSKWSIGVNFLQVAYQYKDINILPYVFPTYVHIWADLGAVDALIKPSEEGRTEELWEHSRSTLMCVRLSICADFINTPSELWRIPEQNLDLSLLVYNGLCLIHCCYQCYWDRVEGQDRCDDTLFQRPVTCFRKNWKSFV